MHHKQHLIIEKKTGQPPGSGQRELNELVDMSKFFQTSYYLIFAFERVSQIQKVMARLNASLVTIGQSMIFFVMNKNYFR